MVHKFRVEHLLDKLPASLVTQPLEFALAFILVVNSARQLFGDPSPSVADLPLVIQDIYMVFAMLGGIGLGIGLCLGQRVYRGSTSAPIPLGVAIERAFLFIVGPAYIALAFVIAANNFQRGLGQAIVCMFVGLACLLRTHGIRRTSRVVIRTIKEKVDGERE